MDFQHQIRLVDWPWLLGVVLGAYAFGCLTTGYYLVRSCTGRDLREMGSGGVGARNVGRFLGGGGFLLTFLGDFAKGLVAVWCALHLTGDKQMAAAALLAVTVGHIWPLQLGFRGGKGVATALGGLAIYDLRLFVWLVCFFAVGLVLCRRSILAGLLALLCLPVVPLSVLLRGNQPGGLSESAVTCAIVFLVILAHRKNIAEEFSRFSESRSLESSPKTKL